MRLAFVTAGDTSRKTGGHRYNARVIHGLRDRGVEVLEVVASPGIGEWFAPEGFDVISVDALACSDCAPHLDSWRERTPMVAMVHELPSVAGSDASKRPPEEPLLRADRLVCVSRHGASILSERGVAAARVRVAPPGLDLPEATAQSGAVDGALRVLCVAQWIPRKGIADLVEAWRMLNERDPGLRAGLELVGETGVDPGYAARISESIADADGIAVRGAVTDGELHRLYAASDLFVLSSTYEGYGMVYAEALSYGLPVLALRTGPVPEVVGEAGMLVEPGDIPALADALHALVSDATLRRRLSWAALRRAVELPGWEETVDRFLETIRAAVAERPLRR